MVKMPWITALLSLPHYGNLSIILHGVFQIESAVLTYTVVLFTLPTQSSEYCSSLCPNVTITG